ncbi:hypothetical protein GF337_03695 [candidate division KSB1 bacterium]|nr:hypothetical protein [candidate division KSB1 bacterium]
MKEKIHQYLSTAGKPVPTAEILQQFFKMNAADVAQAEHIVRAVLGDDQRFLQDENGDWRLRNYDSKSLHNLKFVFVEFETLRTGRRRELPLFLAISEKQDSDRSQPDIYIMDITPETRCLAEKYRHDLIDEAQELKSFSQHAETIYQTLNKTVLVHPKPYRIKSALDYLIRQFTGNDLKCDAISLSRIAKKLYPEMKIRSIEDIASHLDIEMVEPLSFKDRIAVSMDVFLLLLERLTENGVTTLDQLNEFLEIGEKLVHFDNFNFDQEFVKNLPQVPGVYLMKDNAGEIFYVGKARNLKSRLTSYFIERTKIEQKISLIHDRLHDIEIKRTANELEALLTEFEYIRRYNPQVNTQLRVHQQDVSEFRNQRLILFLPSELNDEISMYLLNGTKSAFSLTVQPDKFNQHDIPGHIRSMFFSNKTVGGSIPAEQIEIIWRWLSRNRDSVNYIEMDRIRDLDDCMQKIKAMLSDADLRLQKIFHY